MIYSSYLKQEFNTREECIKAIIDAKDDIIAIKKKALKTTDSMQVYSPKVAMKSTESSVLKYGDIVRNVINTTNYLDSHDDFHAPGIWNKSAVEQNGKAYHVVNHDLSMGSIVAYPNEVNIVLEQKLWRDLGYDFDGFTTALIFESKMTERTNKDAFLAYRDRMPVQHSIRMQYVNIEMAVDDPEHKEAFTLYHKTLPLIANREKAEKQGYLFVVNEAKIHLEGSTVTHGSNDLTPYLGFITQQEEPLKDTQKSEPIDFIAMCKQINFK